MNQIRRNLSPPLNSQQLQPSSLLTKCLSDNKNQKCLSSKISCDSVKFLRRTRLPEGKSGVQIFQRKNKNQGNTKKILFASPQRNFMHKKSDLLPGAKSSEDRRSRIMEKEENGCEKELWKSFIGEIKMNSAFLDLGGGADRKMKFGEGIEDSEQRLVEELKQMRQSYEMIKSECYRLDRQNRRLRKTIEKLEIEIKGDYILKQDHLKQLNKQRQMLSEQKQINNIMEYMVEELNLKIDDLLKDRQSSLSILDDFEGSLNLCVNSSTNSSPFLEHSYLNVSEKMGWLGEMNEKIEKENTKLKSDLKDALKDIKYYELEAAMSKKLREQLILERSLRESYQNRNRVLLERIKEKEKNRKNSYKRQQLDDSLTLSIDL